MKSYVRIGNDLAKNFSQVHALLQRKLSPANFLLFSRHSSKPRWDGGLRNSTSLGARLASTRA